MRRKEPASAQTPGKGKSLISTRTSQQQQRKMQSASARSLLPRSYSSPVSQNDPECQSPLSAKKSFVMRSFSSPESKHLDYRRNSDSFFRPKTHGSRSELDSDLDNFEQFEEGLIDIDADEDDQPPHRHYRSSPERDEPRKVVTTMLPGSGLQKVYMRPTGAATAQTLHSSREAMKKLQNDDRKGSNRLNFKPLVLKMPARNMLHSEEPGSSLSSPGVEELQTSPQLETESNELERELDNAEHHLDRGVAMATEESDADTVRKFTYAPFKLFDDSNIVEHNMGGTMEEKFCSVGGTCTRSALATVLDEFRLIT